jgi:CIC family chloride channel protein
MSKIPEIILCQISQPNQKQDTTLLKETVQRLEHHLHGSIKITPISASSVSEAVIGCSQRDHSDVIMIGASRDRLLRQVMHGNIPEAIAWSLNCTVILV